MDQDPCGRRRSRTPRRSRGANRTGCCRAGSRCDLNEAEQENIAKGAAWARSSRNREPEDLLTDEFAKTLHKRMFGDVRWAGSYRQTEKNIGIEPHRIPVETPMMFDDIRHWVKHETFPPG